MGRPLRLLVPDFPHHVVQRGHNRNAVFADARDYEYYLANLKEWKAKYAVEVHAWCLMSNHVHLVLTPRRRGAAISDLMRRLSARQCRYVNRLERRLGTLQAVVGGADKSVVARLAGFLATQGSRRNENWSVG